MNCSICKKLKKNLRTRFYQGSEIIVCPECDNDITEERIKNV